MKPDVVNRWILIALVAVAWPDAPRLLAQANPDASALHYRIDLSDARNHYVTVSLQVNSEQESTELMMAVWTPGSYLVREYARNIDTISASNGEGQSLPVEKIRKNRWLVENGESKQFTVEYRLYCKEMSVRTNWVGREFAMLNGAPTFVTLPDRLDQPHRVTLSLPKAWNRSATSLNPGGDQPHSFVAKDFDELVDSPIVAGNLQVYPFRAGGVEHQLVNVGESGYWDGSKAATDLRKIVLEHQRMWGTIPYDRYLFLNVIAESGGGLEHDHSTLIMTSRWTYRDPSRYESWLSLASHEFFHTWNVRRLRPKTLVEYDYENEVYTESLWIAEGITSYYEDLALVRAGLISEKKYIDRLAQNIASTQSVQGRRVQSLRDSSYDTWIKFYRPDENSSNTRISYYSKGAVVAFLLDVKIRKLTEGRKSLDDVMRIMYERFVENGYTPADFRNVTNEVAGADLTEWFKDVIDSTEELQYDEIVFVGVEIPGVTPAAPADDAGETKEIPEPTQPPAESNGDEAVEELEGGSAREPVETGTEVESDSKKQDDTAEKPAQQQSEPETSSNRTSPAKSDPWLGIRTSADGGTLTVSRVTADSPATDAGLNVDDEILGINGFRVGSSLDSRLKQFEVGEQVTLLIARRGELMELPVVIGQDPSQKWQLKWIAKPTEAQQQQRKRWLQVED